MSLVIFILILISISILIPIVLYIVVVIDVYVNDNIYLNQVEVLLKQVKQESLNIRDVQGCVLFLFHNLHFYIFILKFF